MSDQYKKHLKIQIDGLLFYVSEYAENQFADAIKRYGKRSLSAMAFADKIVNVKTREVLKDRLNARIGHTEQIGEDGETIR